MPFLRSDTDEPSGLWHVLAKRWLRGSKKALTHIPAYFRERQGEPAQEVELTIMHGRLLVQDNRAKHRPRRAVPLDTIRVYEQTDRHASEIVLADGGRCEVQDKTDLAALIRSATESSAAARTTCCWIAKRVVLPLLIAAVLCTAAWNLAPRFFAPTLAEHIPSEWIKASSLRVLADLEFTALHPSALPESAQNAIVERFALLQAPPAGAATYQLILRSSPTLGATAFTLPNGYIIATDTLWNDVGHDDRRLWQVLESYGHLFHRHALQAATETRFHRLLLALLTNRKDLGVTALTEGLREGHYSPAQQAEAAEYARQMVKANAAVLTGPVKEPLRLSPTFIDKQMRIALDTEAITPLFGHPTARN